MGDKQLSAEMLRELLRHGGGLRQARPSIEAALNHHLEQARVHSDMAEKYYTLLDECDALMENADQLESDVFGTDPTNN